MADGWLPSFVTPADAAAGRAVIEQVAAEHEREIEDDHYGVLIPYTMGTVPDILLAQLAQPPPRPRGPGDASCRSAGTPSSTPSSASSTSARRSSSCSRSPSRPRTGTPPHRRRRRPPPARDVARGRLAAFSDTDVVGGHGRRSLTQKLGPADRISAAMAALRPGIAETPPPRRAPAPQTKTLGWRGLDAPAADVLRALGERPLQVAMEDVAARHAEVGLDLERAHHLDAVRVEQAVLDRLVEHAVERPQDRRRVAAASAPAGSARNRRAGMCSANSVSVWAPAACRSGPRIDGSVSEWQ